MLTTTDAIVLSLQPHSDKAHILHAYTRAGGRVNYMVYGVGKKNSAEKYTPLSIVQLTTDDRSVRTAQLRFVPQAMNSDPYKRTIALFMVCRMITACSQTTVPPEDAGQEGNSAAVLTGPETEEEPQELSLSERTGVPEGTDFGGWNFNALVYTNANWGWDEIIYEELTGESLNDAFYNRNLLVESLLNITITQTARDAGALPGLFKNSVTAGDQA